MSFPLLSVIIPCYNQGKFLMEALNSLDLCDKSKFETIIINDGSTDSLTNKLLEELKKEGYNIIIQENKGLGGARNTGILFARGKYILPLDADNAIYPNYINKSIEILEANSQVAVVYGNAEFFGNKKGVLMPGEFNLQQLMLGNFIDACAVIRKTVLDEVGMYDNMPIMGYEDWDLWLRIAFKGYEFRYFNETLFKYRVTSNSMMRNLKKDIKRRNEIEDYFTTKYAGKLSFDFVNNYFFYHLKKRPFFILYRMVLKKYLPSYYNQLILQHKLYKGHIYD